MKGVAGKKNRIRNLLVLGAIGAGLIPLFVVGLFTYMNATKRPLHPAVEDVPSEIGSAPSAEWADAVAHAQAIARAELAKRNLPGMSIAVGVGADIIWAEGFGWANLEEKARVAPDTRFRIGTASIALTSVAAGLLLEHGKLKLDDEIQTYVPAFPRKPWPVTLRQVMAHTAGLPGDGGDEGPLLARSCITTVDGLTAFADAPLRFEPGTQYRFSSYGWVLVSAAIEAVADEPFFRFMRSQIFEPLDMKDTRFASGDPIPSMATSYFPRFIEDNTFGPELMRPIALSCFAGASAFVSTPSDLVRFAMAINSGALLKPETVRLLQTSQRLPSGEDTGYGLGWGLKTASLSGRSTAVVGHDGDLLGGQAASFIAFPEHGIVVAVLSNTSHAGTHDIAVKIAQAFAAKTK
jgi:serine beta-lactamase-like protein LACTB, mitochondrial